MTALKNHQCIVWSVSMSDNSSYLLKNPKRIAWLLGSLKNQHRSIRLCLDKSDFACNSIIVDTCVKSNSFSLDSVVESTINDRVVAGHPFSLHTSLDGVDVRAENIRAKSSRADPDGLLYVIENPSHLYYMQRRDAYRVSMRGLYKVPVVVQDAASEPGANSADNSLAECFLSNISADGCELALPEECAQSTMVNMSSLHLTFILPDTEESLSFKAIKRHSRILKRSALYLVGCQFVDTPSSTQSSLARFIAEAQQLSRQNSLLDEP